MNRLQQLRLKRGETQQQLADHLSLTQRAISFYELGQRDIPNDVLIKLADHFLCTTDYLLGRIPEEQEKWIQEIARQIMSREKPILTPGLLPGLGQKVDQLPEDDTRKDVIRTVANMDESIAKVVKTIVDALHNQQKE